MGYLPLIITAAILMLIEGLLSIKRNFIQCLIRAGAHLIATLIAFFIAKPVTAGLVSVSQKALDTQLSETADAASVAQYSGLFKNVSPVFSAFIAPFVFILLWIITGIIMFVAYKLVSRAVAPTDADRKRTSSDRILAAVVSVVVGLVLAFIILMPISGTMEVIKDTERVLDESGMLEKVKEELDSDGGVFELPSIDMASAEKATAFSKATYAVTSPMYSYLTSYRIDGKKTTLKKDLPVSASVCADIYSVLSEVDSSDSSGGAGGSMSLDSIDTDTLKKAVKELDNTVVGRSTAAFVLRELAIAIDEEGSFFGEDLSGLKNGEGAQAKLADIIVEKFKNTTADTVSDDIYSFVSAIEVARKMTKITSLPDSKSPDFEKETEETVREIFNKITPKSAEILASVVGALTDNISSDDGSAKAAMSLTADIITGIGKAKADPDTSEEETENTIDAMTKIMVTVYGESEMDADSAVEIIQSCAKSETIMSAVEKTASEGNSDIFGLSSYIEENEEEAQKILSSLESEFSGYDVESIKKLFGFN